MNATKKIVFLQISFPISQSFSKLSLRLPKPKFISRTELVTENLFGLFLLYVCVFFFASSYISLINISGNFVSKYQFLQNRRNSMFLLFQWTIDAMCIFLPYLSNKRPKPPFRRISFHKNSCLHVASCAAMSGLHKDSHWHDINLISRHKLLLLFNILKKCLINSIIQNNIWNWYKLP